MIRLLRHDDTVHREDDRAVRFDDLAELSQGLRVLRLGSASWQKQEDKRKGFSTAWTPFLPNISCISEQSRDIQEVLSLILHCKTMCCCPMTSPSTSTTSGTLTTCTPSSRADWLQEEKVSRGTGSQCFYSREPDVRQSRSGRSSIRSGQTQNYGVQKYLESSPKYSFLVQSEARSKKRIAVLSNPIARNRVFNTQSVFVVRKSGSS